MPKQKTWFPAHPWYTLGGGVVDFCPQLPQQRWITYVIHLHRCHCCWFFILYWSLDGRTLSLPLCTTSVVKLFFLTVEFSPCASSSLIERECHARPTGVLEYPLPSPLPLMPPPVHTSHIFSVGSTYAGPNFTYTSYTSIQFWYKKVDSYFCDFFFRVWW